MTRISDGPVPQHSMFDSIRALRAPVLDQATVDFYLRRGRQERARAFAEMIRGIFSSPAGRRSAELHELPIRRREAGAAACADCTDRAA